MKNLALLSLLLAATTLWADDPVKKVSVNIHNMTEEVIEFKQFESNGFYQSVAFSAQSVPANQSLYEAVQYAMFSYDPIQSGIVSQYNGRELKLMWQLNAGPGSDEGAHLCGVIQDGRLERAYCEMPYVVDETLYIDFIFE